jgi:hypothetical protein
MQIGRKRNLMTKLDAYQAKTDTVLLAMQTMETSHREMVAEFKPETKDTRKEMIAC